MSFFLFENNKRKWFDLIVFCSRNSLCNWLRIRCNTIGRRFSLNNSEILCDILRRKRRRNVYRFWRHTWDEVRSFISGRFVYCRDNSNEIQHKMNFLVLCRPQINVTCTNYANVQPVQCPSTCFPFFRWPMQRTHKINTTNETDDSNGIRKTRNFSSTMQETTKCSKRTYE